MTSTMKSATNTSELVSGSVSQFVNDQHSQLNRTAIKSQKTPGSLSDLVRMLDSASKSKQRVSVAGGRHAMGGQQFVSDGILIDTAELNRVLHLDSEKGTVKVEAGIKWPALIDYLHCCRGRKWSIRQKQTGADRLSIGGSLGSNVHGRGLSSPPLIADIEEFDLVMHDGRTKRCCRKENSELFRLAIGGYGLFGVIYSVTLRLMPRKVLARTVELVESNSVVEVLEKHVENGAEFGDFQFAIDGNSPEFLRRGIMSTYAPANTECIEAPTQALSDQDWQELLFLAHTDKSEAFKRYTAHYLQTNGQLYWSDKFQLATYLDDYHGQLDKRLPECSRGTEVITELYVPRQSLSGFLADAAELLREQQANVIYGTIRMIEKDNESFMPWAKDSFACIVLNLHVEHNLEGIAAARRTFRELIQLAIVYRGCYYLTYHRFASKDQLLTCYPEFSEFVQQKNLFDPNNLFTSDWFDHYC